MHFFSDFFNSVYFDYTLRILASLVCGFLLGIERNQRQEIVGIRTLVLISVSSCLLGILSQTIVLPPNTGDSSRIAAGVASGIGFIGGGAIIKNGMNIKGLTTAAIIFAASSIGLCCGGKLYFPSFVVLFSCLFVLTIFHKYEQKFFPLKRSKKLILYFNSSNIKEKAIQEVILNNGIVIRDVNIQSHIKKQKLILTYSLKCPSNFNALTLTRSLETFSEINKIIFSD